MEWKRRCLPSSTRYILLGSLVGLAQLRRLVCAFACPRSLELRLPLPCCVRIWSVRLRRRPWSPVWSACEHGRLCPPLVLRLVGSVPGRERACGRSDFIGDRWRAFACATCPGVRAIQRGYLPFLGSGGQLLSSLSSVLGVIATLCVSRHASASRPGCALARSLVGCRRWRGVSVNAIDLGGEEPWLVRASPIGCASSPIHSLSVCGLVGYGSGSVSCVWSAQVVMRSCGGEVPLGRLPATPAEACSNLD